MKHLVEVVVGNKRAAVIVAALLLVFVVIMQFAFAVPSMNSSPAIATDIGPDEIGATLSLGQGDTIGYSSWGAVFDLILKLLLVLGLIYLTVKVWKRFVNRGIHLGGRENLINVLETSHLAQNQTLHLVEVGNKILLLGSTANQVTLISDVSDEIDLASVRDSNQVGVTVPKDFADYVEAAKSRLAAWHLNGKLEKIMPKLVGKVIRSPDQLGLGEKVRS